MRYTSSRPDRSILPGQRRHTDWGHGKIQPMDYADDGCRFWRGLAIGLPISLTIWAGIAWGIFA